MSYIYVITNNINGKQYVGKTNRTLQERFKEHLKDSSTRKYEKRPLYNAINKYGKEHFFIEQLEKCDESIVNEREIYWINKLDTYKNGYNATLGGDSKHYYNYQDIANKYLELRTVKDTAAFFNCDLKTVRIACKQYNIFIKTGQQHNKDKYSKPVQMLPEGIIFNSLTEASTYLIENNIAKTSVERGVAVHIRDVCNGKRKTAYKHQWKFV